MISFSREKFVTLLASMSIFIVLSSDPATAQQFQFINSSEKYLGSNCGWIQKQFGAMIMALAWPTATHENTYCTSKSLYKNGVNYNRIVVSGTGLWGGYLQTEFGWGTDRNGDVVWADWGSHNNDVWPPGTSASLTNTLIEGYLKNSGY